MKKILRNITWLFTIALLLPGCLKDKLGEANQEEVITTLNLKFTPVGGGSTLISGFDDPDGPGGNAPTQNIISLARGVVYNVEIELLDKTAIPAADITAEVLGESEAHRIYYETAGAAAFTISNLDVDVNSVPLGVKSRWTSSIAGTGTVKVTLRHYPGTPPGKESSDPVSSPKSGTDIEVTFATVAR